MDVVVVFMDAVVIVVAVAVNCDNEIQKFWKTSKVTISDFQTFDHLKKFEFQSLKLFRKSFDRLNSKVLTSRFDHLTFDLSTPSPH
jgi:hypothetical protein